MPFRDDDAAEREVQHEADGERNRDVHAGEDESLAGSSGGAHSPGRPRLARPRPRRDSKSLVAGAAKLLLGTVVDTVGFLRRNTLLRIVLTWAVRLGLVVFVFFGLAYTFVLVGVSSLHVPRQQVSADVSTIGKETYVLSDVYANGSHTAICNGAGIASGAAPLACTDFLHKGAPVGSLFDALSGEEAGTAWTEIASLNPFVLMSHAVNYFGSAVPGCARVPGETVVVPYDSNNYFHFMLRVLYFLHQYDVGADFDGSGGSVSHGDVISADALYITGANLTGIPREYRTLLANFTRGQRLLDADALARAPHHALCFDKIVPRAFHAFGIDTESRYDDIECSDPPTRSYVLALADRLRQVLDVPIPISILGSDADDAFMDDDFDLEEAEDVNEGGEDEGGETDDVDPGSGPKPSPGKSTAPAKPSSNPAPPLPSSLPALCCSIVARWANGSVAVLANDDMGDGLDRRLAAVSNVEVGARGLQAAAAAAAAAAAPSPPPAFIRTGAGSTCVKLRHICNAEHPLLLLRRSAGPRLWTNEAESVAALRAAGAFVKIVDYSAPGSTVRQQMQDATSACALVGMHGAALTNMLFAADSIEYVVLPAGGGSVPVPEYAFAGASPLSPVNGSLSVGCNTWAPPSSTILMDAAAAQAAVEEAYAAAEYGEYGGGGGMGGEDDDDGDGGGAGGDAMGEDDDGGAVRRLLRAAAPVRQRSSGGSLSGGRASTPRSSTSGTSSSSGNRGSGSGTGTTSGRHLVDSVESGYIDACIPEWDMSDPDVREAVAELTLSPSMWTLARAEALSGLEQPSSGDPDGDGDVTAGMEAEDAATMQVAAVVNVVSEFALGHSGSLVITLKPPVIEVFGHLLLTEQEAEPPPAPLAVYHNLACVTDRINTQVIGLPQADGKLSTTELRDRPATVDVNEFVGKVLQAFTGSLSSVYVNTCAEQ